ncbi:MAG: di-trans,poly-cis-decaprenylcistransferase [Deltaproteobacteria bacterium]|nr:di-trans,poly-cis-decaprenylcistransferase [Deltaproteobacteria bacterium]MBW2416643.1 di-trans,poly-cis-decaprenylcistransferase [Deltaproteobacteria bacterium]
MARLDPANIPRHVAIIPDGNGRWAESRGLPREEGHRAGTEAVREIVRAAHELGVERLTIYTFSTENWVRPDEEVGAIMRLLETYLRTESDELHENGIRVEAAGRIHELDTNIQRELDSLIRRTEGNDEMRLAFALSYSGRSEIVDAARGIARAVEAGRLDPEAIDEKTVQGFLYLPDWPDPDLLIRAGDESRISNFMLWQLAYTEFYISSTLWPDFTKQHFVDAVLEYQKRERRLGKTSAQVQTPT